jgi:hypothetical protein
MAYSGVGLELGDSFPVKSNPDVKQLKIIKRRLLLNS